MKTLKQILKESVSHKLAYELVADVTRSSMWAGKVLLAGGAVRDEILGKEMKDLDYVVAAPDGGIKFAEWLAKQLNIYKSGSNPVTYPRFGTAKLNLRGVKYKGQDLSNIDLEFVMSRTEKYDPRTRKPKVTFGTPQEDAQRRDLTINALMKDISNGQIIDYTGKGIEDLKKGIIRTPAPPDQIFRDDPLRMLRAVRFCVKFDYKLPMYMIKALSNNAHTLKKISSERIRDELDKILMTGSPDKGIRLLQLTGLMQYVAPELDRLKGLKQNKYHSWDANKHTMIVLSNTPADLVTRLAALFHDIGKPTTRTVVGNEVHFYEHEGVSAKIARDIMKRLKYPNEVITAVTTIISNHMRTKGAGDEGEISDKALRKLQADLGPHLQQTLNLIHADNVAHGIGNMPNQIPNIKSKLDKLGTQFTTKVKPPLDGNDIMKLTGFPQGPKVGKLSVKLKDAYMENPSMSKSQAASLIKKWAREL